MTPKMSAYPENTTFPELYHPAVSVCLHLNIDVHTQNINEKTGICHLISKVGESSFKGTLSLAWDPIYYISKIVNEHIKKGSHHQKLGVYFSLLFERAP